MRNRRGYSVLIGTIIMVLVVLFLYFNVYLFKLDRDKDFQDVVSRSQQLDADRSSEKVTISSASSEYGGGSAIVINCILVNNGSVPTQIVRVWLQDYNITAPNVGTNELWSQNIVLQPGVTKPQKFTVVMPSGALAADSFALRLVTSRANLITAIIN